MNLHGGRAVIALLLTCAALGLPLAAWYVTGVHEVQRDVARYRNEPMREARDVAVRIANRVAGDLDSLRLRESERDFLQYQNVYHDPKGAYVGTSVIPSPLAAGPADPMIRAHFQIDAAGRLTLPTINDFVEEDNVQVAQGPELAIREELAQAALSCVNALPAWSPATLHYNGALPAPAPNSPTPINAYDLQAGGQAVNLATQAEEHGQNGIALQEQAVQDPNEAKQRQQTQQEAPQAQTQELQQQRRQQDDLRGQNGQQGGQQGGQQSGRQIERQSSLPSSGQASTNALSNANDAQVAPQQNWKEQTLDSSSWMQNKAANEIYAYNRAGNRKGNETQGNEAPAYMKGEAQAAKGEIVTKGGIAQKGDAPAKGERPAVPPTSTPSVLVPVPERQPEQIVIKVADFQWRTIEVNGEPALMALRTVQTPEGFLTQGFQIDFAELQRRYFDRYMPVKLALGFPTGRAHGEAVLPIQGADWHISVDATPALLSGERRAAGIETQFLWTFGIGATIAVLAGLCVVILVWQSDLLARERSRFAAAAAHELRTPLAGLRMYGEMLHEGLGDPAKSKDYARRVATEAERLGRVVANVLNFTRLERGKLATNPQLGDLVQAVTDCVARQRPALEAAGAKLELDLREALPAVKFDRDALAQIVQNLLDNAEKYSRASSDRTIQVTLVPDAEQRNVFLTVADRGPGISRDLSRRLFKPFSRGSDPDQPTGLGLGLALTRALAHAQGAEVLCTNGSGGGAIFRVRFPVQS
ncbi:MAG: HAMP domain-containing histidine kinase [Planctomycetes bacterium]|nr:HAMP domain-containing histidine kinase [Planctomycetota bacterium]